MRQTNEVSLPSPSFFDEYGIPRQHVYNVNGCRYPMVLRLPHQEGFACVRGRDDQSLAACNQLLLGRNLVLLNEFLPSKIAN